MYERSKKEYGETLQGNLLKKFLRLQDAVLQEEMGNICEIFISQEKKIEIKLKITAERLWGEITSAKWFYKGKRP